MKCAIILLALACCAMAAPTEEDALQEFINGNRRFTAAIYKEILKSNPGNLIVSPFSAETVLALTQEGAKGASAEEMVTGLSLPSTQEKTRSAFKTFLPKLTTSSNDLKLLSANKIYVGNDVKLEDSFRQIAEGIYASGVENVNFAENVNAASTINEWVESRTNNKIRDLINSDSLSEDTKIVLVNALYFSGKWQNQFEEYATQPKKFYKTKDNAVDVKMMHQTDYFRYYEHPKLNAKFLELPYQGSNISMIIVLPNETEGLTAVEENIEEILAPQPLQLERVDVQLPRFRIESEIKFVPILKSLGIEKVFNEDADLSGLSSTHKRLVISDVVQKAFVDVSEGGTEAAASTAVIAVDRVGVSQDEVLTRQFHVNKPFSFALNNNGVIIFAGRVLLM